MMRESDIDQIFEMAPGLKQAVERQSDIIVQIDNEHKQNDWGSYSTKPRVNVFANTMLLRSREVHSYEAAELFAELVTRAIPTAYLIIGHGEPPQAELDLISAADMLREEPRPREWHVPGIIPAGEPTLLFGDGGTGKSLLTLQLAASTSAGRPWLSHQVRQGPAIFFTAEDDRDEVSRRLVAICENERYGADRLDDLEVIAKVGEDALLGIWNADTRMIEPTALYAALERSVRRIQPALLVLDTLADLFGGDENVRAQARQFMGLIKRLNQICGTAIVCLAHPSVAGMNSGSGSSGSTGWSNSARSRLYLERAFEWAGRGDHRKLVEPDQDVRILSTKKNNYGPVGGSQRLRWSDGILAVDTAPLMIAGPAKVAETAAESAAAVDDLFLSLLAAFTQEGRNVSPSPSAAYGPTLFAKDSRAHGTKKAAFASSLRRLLETGGVVVERYGPPSKGTKRLALPSDAGGADGADPPADGGAD